MEVNSHSKTSNFLQQVWFKWKPFRWRIKNIVIQTSVWRAKLLTAIIGDPCASEAKSTMDPDGYPLCFCVQSPFIRNKTLSSVSDPRFHTTSQEIVHLISRQASKCNKINTWSHSLWAWFGELENMNRVKEYQSGSICVTWEKVERKPRELWWRNVLTSSIGGSLAAFSWEKANLTSTKQGLLESYELIKKNYRL